MKLKCPKCGQNIISNNDYCVNCGNELRVQIKEGISFKTLIIIMSVFLVVGISIILVIMFWGTEKELDTILNNQEKEQLDDTNEIKDDFEVIKGYFGNYIIDDIYITASSPIEIINNKDELIGWPVTIQEEFLKVSIYKKDYIALNNLKIFINIENNKKYQQFKEIEKVDIDFTIKGQAPNLNNEDYQYNFLISGNNIYIYAYDTLLKLKRVESSFKDNNNFHKLSLPTKYINNNIVDQQLMAFKNEYIDMVEGDTNYVIHYHYNQIIDNEMVYIILIKGISEPFGHTYITYQTIAYNTDINEVLDLFSYLDNNDLDITAISTVYQQKWAQTNSFVQFEPLSLDTPYYTVNGVLYIITEGEEIKIEL